MLAHEEITSGTTPERWMLFLHGILGRGVNWRGFARRVVKRSPHWGALLVDLRAHGGSRDVPPPDSLAACAADLVALAESREAPVEAVLGHSFGGKVALAFADESESLRKLFVIDSYPGARPGGRGSEDVPRVLDMLDAAPAKFVDRPAFLAYVREAGFSEGLARWLSQSLDPFGDGYEFGLDITRIRALLDDYFARDLFDVIDAPRAGLDVHLVLGADSDVHGEDGEARVRDLDARHEGVSLHMVEGAGHWVHVDAPDVLGSILEEQL